MSLTILFNRLGYNAIKQQGILCQLVSAPNTQQPNRNHSKHWNPKFKWLRSKKVIKVDLPNYHEKKDEVTKEERNRRLKERGVLPPRPWMERPITLSATGTIFEPYVPPEGDGKLSAFSKDGAKQKYEFLEKKSKSMLAVRKIRSYEEDFSTKTFAETAQEVYVKAHEALMNKDRHALREYITERLYPEMIHNTRFSTIRWKFLQSLEPPRVVHARQTNLIAKENIFAQVTVRLHTQQTLAIYDRFGRLIHGSEILAKDVLEYVVFEKNISNLYGTWRMHDKIVPPWAEPKQASPLTYRVESKTDEDEDEDDEDVATETAVEAVQTDSDLSNKSQPPLVTA